MKNLLMVIGLPVALGGCGGLEIGDKPVVSAAIMVAGMLMMLVCVMTKKEED